MTMRMRLVWLAAAGLAFAAGCGDDDPAADDAGDTDADSPDEAAAETGADADADSSDEAEADADLSDEASAESDLSDEASAESDGEETEDGAVPPGLAIERPADGDLVLETAVVDVAPGATAVDVVEVWVEGESAARCALSGSPYRCLVHLDPRASGTATIHAVGLAAGSEVGRATIDLLKEPAFTEECPTDSLSCVRDLVTAGAAAGWAGVVYENMDGLHASLDTSGYPGVVRLENRDALDGRNPGTRTADLDTSLVLLGNASVAQTSPCCMSVPRRSLDLAQLSARFRENKLWWYPEHRDHGYEDFYWFQTIVVGISQGSSGSEMDELQSLMLALGALPTAARSRLETTGQLWSALQYASRRTRMAGDAAYLTTAAHPNALANGSNLVSMMQLARAFTEDRLPPAARLEVLEEDFAPGERRATSAETVARVWSDTTAETHTLRVSGAASVDPAGRPLTWHWLVLRAEGAIDVAPATADGSEVELVIRRHAEETLELNGQPRRTNLGVVALFVHNGLYFSPPAFVTSFTADPLRLAPEENNLD